ncbi:tRNA epoxyqueuosine(34) reductase QueG [Capsulimonas corticalis]|nr:tRNA epoxyqueuosine(34) reductase QueG [Capsulimonas corticalis]
MSTGTRSTPDSPDAILSNLIRSRAAELGFALCGVSAAAPPPHHRHYRQWLAEGRAGEMMYLHRQEPKRGDLSEVLPGVRSVVSLAWNYSPENGRPSAPPQTEYLTGAVARYARFDDYHDLIWARLQSLLDSILAERPDAHGKLYCDTGPVTERDLAMRAGLGWIGKHTNLISRKLGNWFFLAELLLDIDLPPDEPEVPHCGSCTRCIPACPTGAIVAPYTLDARRCISYLTIELKGSIPEELRPLIGTRIYGCDECLAVCPWNKFAQRSSEPAVRPRADLTAPDLLALLALDDAGFKEKFRSSPIKRAKRRGLLRNVCVALGNIGDIRAIPALTTAMENDPEPLVREHAAWALERIAEANP